MSLQPFTYFYPIGSVHIVYLFIHLSFVIGIFLSLYISSPAHSLFILEFLHIDDGMLSFPSFKNMSHIVPSSMSLSTYPFCSGKIISICLLYRATKVCTPRKLSSTQVSEALCLFQCRRFSPSHRIIITLITLFL